MSDWDQDEYVVVIGSSALDVKATVEAVPAASANLPGSIRIGLGGVARNIAECLARLEVPTALISAVGSDMFSDYLWARTANAGVNMAPTLRVAEGHVGAYVALFHSGGQRMAVADMKAFEHLTAAELLRHRALIAGARAVVIDNNLSDDGLARLIDICQSHGVSLTADPTSPYLAPRLLPHLGAIQLIAPNQAEAAVLCQREIHHIDDALQAAKQLVSAGVRMALVTMGDMGAVYATAYESGHVRAPYVDVVDLTGGSDAMTATVVYSLINDFPPDEAVRLAVTAAALTITSEETVRDDLSLELLYDNMSG
ncbi:MAG: bifunctional hydroxymethylpyrimidine kinase/phosphomethylpyrimidine kinase [Anaerolineales bacterium]|nr:bifunctional hydroxymethylpyrimidine kinase/phosphomethylpyrimidine kinase [Anaerolineales bacterium]MCB9127791.1 bifunctional hydroxymethylpyrimidine kinase/phosphomethylpyrimidine kinase [Ardenticatenales bacterium]